MTQRVEGHERSDTPPGDTQTSVLQGVRSYLIGLSLAAAMTGISFWVAIDQHVFWQPGVAIGLCVLAIAQVGIHLVFFLHLTTGPDNINNALAVAFGALIVLLIGVGSLWIMANLNGNMIPTAQMTNLHQQR